MKITFANKVENSGSTNDGKVFAANMNEIKNVVNTNEDLRIGQTSTQGIYSSTLQSLVFKNSLNATIFSISLADLVTGGGGISDAPADNLTYARKNNAWISFTAGIADAPNNSFTYARSGGGWVQVSSGLSDAPSDTYTYARKDGAWVQISTGGSGGVTVHNDLTNRDASSCHPISAITDLQTTLTNINTAIGGKANKAGDITQDFSAKVLTIGTSIILNGRTLTINTL